MNCCTYLTLSANRFHACEAIEIIKLFTASPENYESNKELAAIVRELCAAYKHPLPESSLGRSDAAIAKVNETDHAKPTKENLDKLVVMRSKRFTFIGVEDFLARAEVDRYLKEYTA